MQILYSKFWDIRLQKAVARYASVLTYFYQLDFEFCQTGILPVKAVVIIINVNIIITGTHSIIVKN